MITKYLCIIFAALQAFTFSAFTNDKTQTVGVNGSTDIYRTDAATNCERICSGRYTRSVNPPAKSITTIVLNDVK